ncbi:hypothetical protein FACS1894190_04540 [Spirochaetia bacterium]|nr:hypothetical protein FACS1894190_04540 [Spirochaetia bacterium]
MNGNCCLRQPKIEKKTIIRICALVLTAVVSIFVIEPIVNNPRILQALNKKLDTQIQTATVFFASATAASVAVSALPGDMGSMLSKQLADVAGFFLLVIGVIALEKIILIVSPFLSFVIIIPIAALFFIFYIIFNYQVLKKLGIKSALFAFILFIAVPVSLTLSTVIESKLLQSNLDKSIIDINKDEEKLTNTNNELSSEQSDQNPFQKFGKQITKTITSIGTWIQDKALGAMTTAQNMLAKLVNSLITMIFTTIIIPLCTMAAIFLSFKTLFGLDKPRGKERIAPRGVTGT